MTAPTDRLTTAATLAAIGTDHRLTSAEMHALLVLAALRERARRQPVAITMRELAAAMHVGTGTASRRVARLRRLGLVEAHPDPQHQRATAYLLDGLDAAVAAGQPAPPASGVRA